MVESRVCWRISRPGQQATAREKRAGAWTMANPRADQKVAHVTPRPQSPEHRHRHRRIPSAPPLRGQGTGRTLAEHRTPLARRASGRRNPSSIQHPDSCSSLAIPPPGQHPATIPPISGSQLQPPPCRSLVAELSRLSPDPDYMRPRWPGPPQHSADYSPPLRSSSRRMGSSMWAL